MTPKFTPASLSRAAQEKANSLRTAQKMANARQSEMQAAAKMQKNPPKKPMKKGGSVMDGVAKRGKTRGKFI